MGKPKQSDIDEWVKKGKHDKLIKLLTDKDLEAQKMGVIGLGQTKDVKVVKSLLPLLNFKANSFLFPDVINALIGIGPAALDEIQAFQAGKNEDILKEIAKVYIAQLNEKSIGFLLALSQTGSDKFKLNMQDLMKPKQTEITKFFLQQLDSADPQTKKTAAATLLEKGGADWKMIYNESQQAKILGHFTFDELIASPKPIFRLISLDLLARSGVNAIPQLLTLVDSKESDLVDKARLILSQIGKNGLDMFIAELSNPNPVIRLYLIELLGQIKDRRALVPLINQLNDANPVLIAKCIESIGLIGDKQAIEHVAIKYNHPDAKVRENVAVTLGKLADPRCLAALLYLINDPIENIQLAAIRSLGSVKDIQSIPYMIPLIKHANPNIAAAAIEVLGKLGGTNIVPMIQQTVHSENVMVRKAAATALGNIGGPETVGSLLEFLNDKETIVVSTAAMAIGKMKLVQAIPALTAIIKGQNDVGKRMAVKALTQIGSNSLESLCSCLEDPRPQVKELALDGIGDIGDDRCVSAVAKLLDDPIKMVQENAARVLDNLVSDHKISPLSPAISSKVQSFLVKKIS